MYAHSHQSDAVINDSSSQKSTLPLANSESIFDEVLHNFSLIGSPGSHENQIFLKKSPTHKIPCKRLQHKIFPQKICRDKNLVKISFLRSDFFPENIFWKYFFIS
jgi:hypothetical protein